MKLKGIVSTLVASLALWDAFHALLALEMLWLKIPPKLDQQRNSPPDSQTICERPEGVSNLVVYWFCFSNWTYFFDLKGRRYCTLKNT